MNERSTFSVSTEKRFKYDSDEYPVPKSSSAMRTPSRFNAAIFSCTSSGYSIIAVSVISSSRLVGGDAAARDRALDRFVANRRARTARPKY